MRQFLRDHDVRSFAGRHQALIGFLACLVLIFGTVAYVAHKNSQTTRALCALRADQETKVRTGKAFLVEHPDGIPGLSATVIRTGIANQERTAHALRFLSC